METAIDLKQIQARQLFLKLSMRVFIYAMLILGALFIFIPFGWTLSTALKTDQQVLAYPPVWIPSPVVWENFVKALTIRPFHIYYFNTFLIAFICVTAQVLSSSLVAYGFARFRFPGRNLLFFVLLSTMMLPSNLLLVPRFILFKTLGWLDTFLPLTIPHFFGSAFSIFLMRQYLMGIPLELDEAAKIDGAGPLRVYSSIIFPLVRPALGAIAVFEFVSVWRDFMGPLIYLSSEKHYTVSLGLAAFKSEFFTEWNLFMAAAVVAMLPPLIVFFIAQKYFISGASLTGSGASKG
ncbi:carbohydrate ABC transporter permease [Spirochaetia bacterium 38H-sp]|uniref:Carbohydrate ABC transporter permease n=1 Tax=Rarispira pelagica TaxID=3141764 RepID=A0ABU9UCQ2_9SPIR